MQTTKRMLLLVAVGVSACSSPQTTSLTGDAGPADATADRLIDSLPQAPDGQMPDGQRPDTAPPTSEPFPTPGPGELGVPLPGGAVGCAGFLAQRTFRYAVTACGNIRTYTSEGASLIDGFDAAEAAYEQTVERGGAQLPPWDSCRLGMAIFEEA